MAKIALTLNQADLEALQARAVDWYITQATRLYLTRHIGRDWQFVEAAGKVNDRSTLEYTPTMDIALLTRTHGEAALTHIVAAIKEALSARDNDMTLLGQAEPEHPAIDVDIAKSALKRARKEAARIGMRLDDVFVKAIERHLPHCRNADGRLTLWLCKPPTSDVNEEVTCLKWKVPERVWKLIGSQDPRDAGFFISEAIDRSFGTAWR